MPASPQSWLGLSHSSLPRLATAGAKQDVPVRHVCKACDACNPVMWLFLCCAMPGLGQPAST